MKKSRILVAMSGGVDSSVAALLLKQKGHDITGVTMCLGIPDSRDDSKARCCGADAIQDAKKVCVKLDMAHHVLDFAEDMQKEVIDNMVSEYSQGRTPNPCVRCNNSLKFRKLLDYAKKTGFDFLATGHYAKREHGCLKKPLDRKKDQTYFLYGIKKEDLDFVFFPLSDITKDDVRQEAQKNGLPVADKPQSQDICFIPGRNYKAFLDARMAPPAPGPIVHRNGDILGEHKGICFYTIGQREGLGIGFGTPLYVVSIDARTNCLVVGSKEDLLGKELLVKDINLLHDDFSDGLTAKIRYAHQPASCVVARQGDTLRVVFKEFQESITPGQSIVFYQGDVVLGGGLIDKVMG